MSLPRIEVDLGYVSKLDDNPNDVGGLDAAELKAVFDKAGLTLQEYINTTLIPQIESDIEAAALGIGGGGQIGIEKLPDKSIGTLKLEDGSVTTSILADGSVTGAKVVDGIATTKKIADNAVTREKIPDQAISAAKIFPGAVTSEKIPTGAITKEKLSDSLYNKVYYVEVPTEGWTADNTGAGGYVIELPVEGLLETDMGEIHLSVPETLEAYYEQRVEYDNLWKAYSEDGLVRIYSEYIPAIPFTINILASQLADESTLHYK